MSAGFIVAAVAAIVLALLFGIVLGRSDRTARLAARRRLTRHAPRESPTPGVLTEVSAPAADTGVFGTDAPVPADRPREVSEGAALRVTDVASVTADGRMTKAGLLSLIVRHTEVGVAVVDSYRDVVLYNHRAIELGIVNDRLLADPVWDAVVSVLETDEDERFDFVPPISALGFLATGRSSRRGAESVRCLARLVAQDDEEYVVIYGTDDTENIRVEATRRDFVANVSHELKTPVGAISLLAEALLESADDADSVRHFGHRVVAEAGRMGRMVSELIALSRLEGGETPEFTAVDVDQLVEDAVEGAAVGAEAAGITLRCDDKIGISIFGDRMLLLTALSNLLVNAIAYSPANTTVSLSRRVTVADGVPMVAIAVTDRGIGIQPSDQQRVFERFFRVDKARSRHTGGTGLGLAIVKHVAATHHGNINLWSQPGTGSTFTLSIPQDVGADDAAQAQIA
ncbi:sensor histidine kinase [Gordonia sp. NPDC003376]